MLRSQKRFLYTHKIFLVIALLLFIVFVLPFAYWSILPTRPLSLFLIDKTTADDYREHRSLFWLLTHWKYVDPVTGTYYDATKDFYGYDPADSSFSPVEALQLNKADLLYIADTYGVYRYPMNYDSYERLLPDHYIPIQFEYGGLSAQEMDAIESFDSLGRMSIAEFNTLQDPQLDDWRTQRRLERMFGVHYTGALGRYYDDLNSAARWMKDLYERRYLAKWDFSGRGIIIIVDRTSGDDKTEVVVLDAGDLAHTPVFIRTSADPLLQGTEDEVPYYYFFEFLTADSTSQVIAEYEIECTKSGREKMDAAGLPVRFPAVVSTDAGRKLYFGGDFVDNRVETMLTQYWNVEFLLTKLFSFYFVSDQTRFFWKFYLPMMENVFRRATDRSLAYRPSPVP
ncbi:MAG: hypothetical protein HUU02_01595 [Bacteroidetes bacterium]|nr:hypothetical protein [Bacteroidota bacterium]